MKVIIGRFNGVALIVIAVSLLAACARTPEEGCGSKEVIQDVLWQAGYRVPDYEINGTTYPKVDTDVLVSGRKELREDFKQRFLKRHERLKTLRSGELSTAELDAVADMCFTNDRKERVCLFNGNVENVRVQTFDRQTGACDCKADYVYSILNLTLRTEAQSRRMEVVYRSETTIKGQPYVSGVDFR